MPKVQSITRHKRWWSSWVTDRHPRTVPVTASHPRNPYLLTGSRSWRFRQMKRWIYVSRQSIFLRKIFLCSFNLGIGGLLTLACRWLRSCAQISSWSEVLCIHAILCNFASGVYILYYFDHHALPELSLFSDLLPLIVYTSKPLKLLLDKW